MQSIRFSNEIRLATVILLICLTEFSFGQTVSKTDDSNPITTDIIKCEEDDIDCFIEAAKSCRKASYTRNDSADFGAVIFIKNDYFEIKEGNSAACQLYTKVLKWEAVENEEYLEELKKRGEEPPKVDEKMQKASDDRMKKFTGTDGVCTFTTEKLTALFERWKAGTFSTNDYRGANCKGSYFVPENGFPKRFLDEFLGSILHTNAG